MSKFKVLWIDDQTKKCKREVVLVEKLIISLGFEPDVVFETNISQSSLNESDGALYKAIHARDVDLFLVDYNLKNDVFGSDIVRQIRNENDIYTDIVFYSNDRRALVDQIKNSYESESSLEFCDGVYVVPLGNEFIIKVEQIITKTIKSWYNVHSIRGIILSKSSKFEQMVSKIIGDNYITCLDEIKGDLRAKGENVCRTTKDKWARVGQAPDPIPDILDDPINFNWTAKKLILQRMHDEKAVSVSSWDDIEYIFDLRNKVAHNPMHLRDGVLVLSLKDQEEIYTEKEIDEIRQALTRVEDDLMRIMSSAGITDIDFGFIEETEKELCAV